MSLDFIKKCYSFEIADSTMILEEFRFEIKMLKYQQSVTISVPWI